MKTSNDLYNNGYGKMSYLEFHGDFVCWLIWVSSERMMYDWRQTNVDWYLPLVRGSVLYHSFGLVTPNYHSSHNIHIQLQNGLRCQNNNKIIVLQNAIEILPSKQSLLFEMYFTHLWHWINWWCFVKTLQKHISLIKYIRFKSVKTNTSERLK